MTRSTKSVTCYLYIFMKLFFVNQDLHTLVVKVHVTFCLFLPCLLCASNEVVNLVKTYKVYVCMIVTDCTYHFVSFTFLNLYMHSNFYTINLSNF